MVKAKAEELMKPCTCGSGKMAGMCHRQGDVAEIANEPCICGSGKMIKDCCLKSPEAHAGM